MDMNLCRSKFVNLSYLSCDKSALLLMKMISKLNCHLSYSSYKNINYKKNGTSLWSIQQALDDKSVVQNRLDIP
jgi:hypothetical protein